MKLKRLLIESARELRRRPSFFLPKLLTSLIGSLWILGIFSSIGDPLTPNPDLESLYIGLMSFPLVFFLGLLSPVIVAEMVKNKHNVLESTKRCLKHTPKLLMACIILIIGFTVAIIPAYLGALYFILSDSIILLCIGLIISFVAILIITYGVYFLPVTLLDNSSMGSIRESLDASKNNRKEVTFLVILSFALLGVASLSSGAARALGITGFILGRMISASITTYTLIVSPKMYLEEIKP